MIDKLCRRRPGRPAPSPRSQVVAIGAAVALPGLLAFNVAPSPSLYNQLIALVGWGIALRLWAMRTPNFSAALHHPATMAGLLILLGPLSSVLFRGLPLSIGLCAMAVIAAGLSTFVLGFSLDSEQRERAAAGLCAGLLVMGIVNAVVSYLQVFHPLWIDPPWVARSGVPGRAVGNMRQPNHLATLTVWSAIAAVHLCERLRKPWPWLACALLLCTTTITLSASRTGVIGLALLTAWGLLSKQLNRSTRLCLISLPAMLAVCWLLIEHQSTPSGVLPGAVSRLAEGAGSPTRVAILRQAWALLSRVPWAGVGWGQFNFAWSLTPMPHRTAALFDHVHNLPAQLLVELGIPWATIVLALLGWSIWTAVRNRCESSVPVKVRHTALMLVAMVSIHSLLEYPLWYAYFLLPSCFALGLAMPVRTICASGNRAAKDSAWGPKICSSLGTLLVLGATFAVWDFDRVARIYRIALDVIPLEQRIAEGQRSVLFKHHADYAAAINLSPGPESLAAAQRAAYRLIDADLLIHWAEALEAVGQAERAQFLIDRLREFPTARSNPWWEQCQRSASRPAAPQCRPPAREMDWRQF